MYSAYITKIEANLKEDLLRSLEFRNGKEHVKTDSPVFVKPNFTFPYHKEGITTSPELLKNLLEILKERVDNLFLGESCNRNHLFFADYGFKSHNIYVICREPGIFLNHEYKHFLYLYS